MRYCSEDASRTGERNVNFNKNTSENAVLNKMCKPDERAPSFIFKQNFEMLCQTSSSVAAGGLSPSIGLKSMQNTTFLVLLRRIFAPKMKIAPPMGLAIRSCEGLAVIWT